MASYEVEVLKSEPVERHLTEMRSNFEAWRRSGLLRALYSRFYQLIKANLAPIPGPIVELGSGIGAVKEFIPECITTDIFPNPWLDRRENAYALNFPDESVSSLILLDVFHHLKYPGTALNEFRRVLSDNGRVIIFEPGIGFLGKLIYGLFHHEPLGLYQKIEWFAPVGFDAENAGYFAAQANASRIFLGGEFKDELRLWSLVSIKELPEIAYVASGGFSKPQLFPSAALPLIRSLERFLSAWPSLFCTRLLVVLAKKGV